MKISFLCSEKNHPVRDYLNDWIKSNKNKHSIELVRSKNELSGGDILFLISCHEIIEKVDRSAYGSSLVLHASNLPQGKGWSPHIWEIINGAKEITLTLLEAEDSLDSGKILKKILIPVKNHTLWDEINNDLFRAEIDLINFAIESYNSITPQEQDTITETIYYRKRTPEDSRIDPSISIDDQFNLIRVCDPKRFPAFFELYGHRYKIILEKLNDE